MNIDVKGHSGCQIQIIKEQNKLFILKTTHDANYVNRLMLQAQKQKKAATYGYQHIRVPIIFDCGVRGNGSYIKMQYIYSRNFMEFFEQAGFEQIGYFITSIAHFIEQEIERCTLQKISPSLFLKKFASVKSNLGKNVLCHNDTDLPLMIDAAEEVFSRLEPMVIPVGVCHGDLTLSNILFSGNNYYLIDFLDSFIETPLQDIVKLRQDTAYYWSQLMYDKHYDDVRLHIICQKIDDEIDAFFKAKYEWYRSYYDVMQLMNILRILPYCHEARVFLRLKAILKTLLK